MLKKFLPFGACIVCLMLGSSAWGQAGPDPASLPGIVPDGSFHGGDIDSVNLLTGNLVIQSPLYVLPQLGRMTLSYQLQSNTNNYQISVMPEPNAEPYVGLIPNLQWGPFIVSNSPTSSSQGLTISSVYCAGEYSTSCGTYSTTYGWGAATDSSGAVHPLYLDSQAQNTYRAVDGSGYAFVKDPAGGGGSGVMNGTLIEPNGVGHHTLVSTSSSGAVTTASSTDFDPDGNTITAVMSSSPYPFGPWTLTDTIGRSIPAPPYPYPYPPTGPSSGPSIYGSPTTGCPNLNEANQPIIGSLPWSVPGPNGATTQYLVCFTQFYYKTNFWNGITTTPSWGVAHYDESYGLIMAIQSVVLPDGTSWKFVYDATDSSYSSPAFGSVTKVILPAGGSISYQYTPIVPNKDSTCGLLQVTQRAIDPADGSPVAIWKYSYSIGTTVVTDPNQNDTVVTFAPLPGELTPCSYTESQRQMYQGSYTSGTLLRTTKTSYQFSPGPYSGSYQIYWPLAVLPTEVDATDNVTQQKETTTYSYDPGFNATIDGTNTSLISLGKQIEATTTGYDGKLLSDVKTYYQWQAGSPYYVGNFLDDPSTVTVSNGSSNAQTFYQYDGGGSPSVALGHLTSVNKWLNTTGQWVTTSTGFNSQGMPNLQTDAKGNKTSFPAYACSGLFPQNVINALGQVTAYSYNNTCNTGRPTSVTDPNSKTTTFAYNTDPLGRLKQVVNAAGAYTNYGYPSPTQVTINQDEAAGQDGMLSSNIIYDGLGRVTHQKAPSGAVTDTTYDGLGRVLCVSNPHFGSVTSTDGSTCYVYDALGRKAIQTQPDGSRLQWCYNGFASNGQTNCHGRSSGITTGPWVDSADETGLDWQRVSDALGRLTNVVEPGGLPTSYSYDALGNLLSATQSGASGDAPRSRTFAYDSLSRLLCASNPENSTAACPATSGAMLYSYDPNGNVTSKTDARGVATSYTYDALNRIATKSYPGDPAKTPTVCYQYDTGATNGIGRLVAEWTQSASLTTCGSGPPATGALTQRMILAYDPIGRVANERQCVGASCSAGPTSLPSAPSPCASATWLTAPYYQAYCYDLAGNLIFSTNGTSSTPVAGNLSFTNAYDTAGRLSSLTSNWNDPTHPGTLFSLPSYSPPGGLTGASYGIGTNYGPGVVLTRTYDNRLRATGEADTGGSATGAPTPGSATVTITGQEQTK